MLAKGIDPRHHRKAKRREKVWTFDECAAAYIEAHEASWSNEKHVQQWRNTLRDYATPVFGELPVAEIETHHVLEALEPVWQTKTETATRVRQRIEAVLAWAIARKYREGPNPALWRGHLDQLLPKPTRVKKVRHQPAMPYSEIGVFMEGLRTKSSVSALALQFLILTATRTSEVLGATWDEIDRESAVWTTPADRMKARREHRVPLSRQALVVLDALPDQHGPWLFPSTHHGKHLSNMALLALMRKMGFGPSGKHGPYVPHGFRSTFRVWCAEQTSFPREVAEQALAHVVQGVEGVYQRGDLLERRRKVMQAWADHCDRAEEPGKVVPLRREGAK
jgi:integrase